MTIKLALPAGDARPHVNQLLSEAGLATTGYEPGSRLMRSELSQEGLVLRIFREKDIPIQVALGNYDVGLCNSVWLAEQQVRFPLQRVVCIGELPGPAVEVWLCAGAGGGLAEGELPATKGVYGVRIVSELANLADLVAVNLRLPAYKLLHVYGSVEAYPPEDAELAIVMAASVEEVRAKGLLPLAMVFRGGLSLIANADALATKPLGEVIGRLAPKLVAASTLLQPPRPGKGRMAGAGTRDTAVVRLAVPDGHAQRHAPAFLRRAGFNFEGYDEKSFVRRPKSNVEGLEVKVVRPQDMPQLIAMGMFDLGIGGQDLLYEHQCKFPASPVEMAVDLGINRYRIGPVVDEAFPARTTAEAITIWNALGRPVRIASEFPAMAERFALDNHLRFASIIPVAGASEGFVPEDADFLVEGVETGSSLIANGLKLLDPFMHSTSCVILGASPVTARRDLLHDVVERLRGSVQPTEG